MNLQTEIVPAQDILPLICSLRDARVILDRDLANLYWVQSFRLNEAVKRNRDRFPEDFRFQLTAEERDSLTSQFAMVQTSIFHLAPVRFTGHFTGYY